MGAQERRPGRGGAPGAGALAVVSGARVGVAGGGGVVLSLIHI